jgi:hypothetical protein
LQPSPGSLSIKGTPKQKTITQSLVGISADEISVHSVDNVPGKILLDTSVRYPLSKIDPNSLLAIKSKFFANLIDTALLPGKPFHFGIDFTRDPYYGEVVNPEENSGIKGSMADFSQFSPRKEAYRTLSTGAAGNNCENF